MGQADPTRQTAPAGPDWHAQPVLGACVPSVSDSFHSWHKGRRHPDHGRGSDPLTRRRGGLCPPRLTDKPGVQNPTEIVMAPRSGAGFRRLSAAVEAVDVVRQPQDEEQEHDGDTDRRNPLIGLARDRAASYGFDDGERDVAAVEG
jgi:hypothetical protein